MIWILAIGLLLDGSLPVRNGDQERSGRIEDARGAATGQEPAAPNLDAFAPALRDELARAAQRAQREPGSAAAAGELGMLLHAHQQLEAAADWYGRARRLDPHEFDWAYGAGLTQTALGRANEAVAALRDATRLQPASLTVRLKLAEALFAAAAIDESGAVYRDLLDVAPRLPQAHYGMGRIATARLDPAAAAKHYAAAIELYGAYAAARYALALAYRDLGDVARARDELARYERDTLGAPPLPDPFLDRVDALTRTPSRHLNAGIALSAAGDIDGAIREHEQAIASDPTLAQAHIHLITLYGRKGDVKAAERHYKAVLALNSHTADAHYNYGVLLAYAGRNPEAEAAFRMALEVDPYYAPAHNNLGQIVEREQRVAEAAEHYRRAVEADPRHRVARFNLGRMLVALNRPREAIEQFLTIVEPADEQAPTYLYALAAAFVRAGDRENARTYGTRAQRLAEELGQRDLAATIARDLEKLR